MSDKIVDLTTSVGNIVGVDCGTMFLVSAKKTDDNKILTKSLRNTYLPIEVNQMTSSELTNIDHITDGDNVYIIGEDAYRLANIFGHKVKRPMNQGLISSDDIDGLDVLALMMQQLVGTGNKGTCVYCIPAPSIDKQNDITYHKGVFRRIFSELGFKNIIDINEAMAVIYSECQNEMFTGLAFSFGAGMSNVALSWKANTILSFSVARGGDWIDESAARSLATVPNRVTSIKENNTNLMDFKVGDKKERRMREAIVYYYRELITYVLDNVRKKLDTELSNVDLPESLPIVISGGTSKAKGFVELFTEIINSYSLPFKIKEIRTAQNQLTSVAEGCLIKAIAEGGK